MGVSGCGKSTVGAALSLRLGLPFRDGDDLHPLRNIRKMCEGEPLDDADRWPWLDRCGAALRAAEGGLILGCSALRRRYRDRLRESSGLHGLRFIHLHADQERLCARVSARKGHFMPATLLRSQFAALELPDADEAAITVAADRAVPALLDDILTALADDPSPGNLSHAVSARAVPHIGPATGPRGKKI